MKIWIGCSGWHYDEWKDKFYPKELAKHSWFEFYKKHFNTVELNYPFYRNPTEKTIKQWHQQTDENFRFSIKVNRNITHYKKFKNTQTLLKDFYSLFEILEKKLGCMLFQFPKNLHYSETTLERIITQLDKKKSNVLEFRHPSWWQQDVFDYLQKENIIFCTVSAPDIPSQLIKTSDIFYMRLHGKTSWYAGNYTHQELNEIAQWINKNHFKEIWIYFDNTINADAPKNALALLELLKNNVSK